MADTMAPRETTARLRHLRTSPTKIRPVLKLISGQDVLAARDTLRLCERGVAEDLEKLLDSAIANAEHNDNVPEDELFISRAFADEGPTQKRWRPRARGRGTRIRKRTSHITIVVARFEDDELDRRRRTEAAAGGAARRRPTRRRAPKVEHDHEHDHDTDEAAEPATAEKTAKKATATKSAAKKTAKKTTKTTKKTTKKAATSESGDAPAKKSTAKKAAKKTTAKKTAAKKSSAKKPAASDEKDA